MWQQDPDAPSGTGLVQPFVRIQHDPTEQGYNTTAADQFNEKGGSFSPIVNINSLQVVHLTPGDGGYYEFVLGVHQSGSNLISLDGLQIYQAASSGLTGFHAPVQQGGNGSGFGADAHLVFDLDANGDTAVILLSSLTHGNGTGDAALFVPVGDFTWDPAANPYIYLYSAFGQQPGDSSNSTFEEWDAITATTTPTPGISLDKQVSVDGGVHWFDKGGALQDPSLLGSAGVDPIYQFIVTNTGNTVLHNVTLSDIPALGGLPAPFDLNPGESQIFQVTTPWTAGEHLDTATVSADGGVTATDQADYYGATPGVTIDKEVSGFADPSAHPAFNSGDWFDKAADMTAPVILAGKTVYFQALVHNTDSHIDLTAALVKDYGAVTLGNPSGTLDGSFTGPGSIAAGDTKTYTFNVSAVAGLHEDKAVFTGTATDSGNHTSTWTASDDANYFGADPEIAIQKETNGHPNGGYILVGTPITWTYTVSNPGNVALSITSIIDNKAGTPVYQSGDANSNGLLDTDEHWVYTLSGTATLGVYTNTGTVTGSFTDDFGNSASPKASDDSGYVGLKPAPQGEYLTKGFWSNHPYVYDRGTANDASGANGTGDNWWSGVAAAKTSASYKTFGNEGQLYFSSTSTQNVISQSSDINPNSTGYLVLGDVTGNPIHLALKDGDAATLMTTSVSGDARIILATQAYASQLNDYNLHGEPLGLIEEAAKWLTTSGDPVLTHTLVGGNVDTNTANGTLDAAEYSVSKGVFSFVPLSSAVSSSSHAFQSVAPVFDLGGPGTVASVGSPVIDYQGHSQTSGTFDTFILANANALANALNDFNNGRLVILSDGSNPAAAVAWFDGSSYSSITPNTSAGAFWQVMQAHDSGGISTGLWHI